MGSTGDPPVPVGDPPTGRVRQGPGSAGFPACGFAELSSSAMVSAVANWGLESPQHPQTGMSALRRGTGTGRHWPVARATQRRVAGLALRCPRCLMFSRCFALMAARSIPPLHRSKSASLKSQAVTAQAIIKFLTVRNLNWRWNIPAQRGGHRSSPAMRVAQETRRQNQIEWGLAGASPYR